MVYGASIAYHSQSQKHQEQVVQIDGAIKEWEDQYMQETREWKPILNNDQAQNLTFSELNTPDFHSQFSDLDTYTVVKYNIDSLASLLEDSTVTKKSSSNNGEFNLTTTFIVNFDDGSNLSLDDIPVYVRKKSGRSKKD